jgi:hypothetical protein
VQVTSFVEFVGVVLVLTFVRSESLALNLRGREDVPTQIQKSFPADLSHAFDFPPEEFGTKNCAVLVEQLYSVHAPSVPPKAFSVPPQELEKATAEVDS